MIRKLAELKGAGLAAPQIGESLRIIVVEVQKNELFPDRPESPLYVMINPEVTYLTNDKESGWESCFSVPGLIGLVSRYKEIRVNYTSPDGSQHTDDFDDYLARVIQHECDHLEGVVYLDRMESMQTISTIDNWRNEYIKVTVD
jgi:peptide deformylase